MEGGVSDEEIEKVPDDAGEGLNDADIYDDEGYVRASYLAPPSPRSPLSPADASPFG